MSVFSHRSNVLSGKKKQTVFSALLIVPLFAAAVTTARADLFNEYDYFGAFGVPPDTYAFDVLPDGRLVTVSGDHVSVESNLLSRDFVDLGQLPAGDIGSFGVAFLRVSPDGTRIAIGNNGGATFSNYQVGVFTFPTLAGTWFDVNHFDAEWYNNTFLALTTSSSDVTMLDTASPNPASPINPVIVSNVSGASAGITFDASGNLYTGDGFSPTDTGVIKAFSPSQWLPALTGEPAADFQTGGTTIVDILSAASLGFDAEGNLHVAGGDFVGGADVDFVALANGNNVQAALNGGGPIDVLNASQLRRLDPEPANPFNFYNTNHNLITGELYVQDFGSPVVHVYSAGSPVPTASTWGLVIMAGLLLVAARITFPRFHARTQSA